MHCLKLLCENLKLIISQSHTAQQVANQSKSNQIKERTNQQKLIGSSFGLQLQPLSHALTGWLNIANRCVIRSRLTIV